MHLLQVDVSIPASAFHDDHSSEDEFEVHTRLYGDVERGVRLEGRSGIDPNTGYVNQERTRAILYGVSDFILELETVDGVFQGSYAELTVTASEPTTARILGTFKASFSRP